MRTERMKPKWVLMSMLLALLVASCANPLGSRLPEDGAGEQNPGEGEGEQTGFDIRAGPTLLA